jgi:type I restriction-modification system DNA methylase subunit
MTAKTIQTSEIKQYLQQCGYQDSCLQEPYAYFAEDRKHVIDLAGFARETFNSESACIGFTNAVNISENKIKEHVLSYRELGAPVILVTHGSGLQFWKYQQGDAVWSETIQYKQMSNFFGTYRDQFNPEEILRAKTIGRANRNYQQLSFVDYGLMPLIEEKEGKYLSRIITRSIDALSKYSKLDPTIDVNARWLIQAAFWLIGAKILKDKGVDGFKLLDLADISSLIDKVRRHYNAESPLSATTAQKNALKKVADEIVKPISSLSHVTINSLSYVYENTLVTPTTRKALGTHATPSWLVNYIVWQMADWVAKIPQKDRVIFEPACGHAPFLTVGSKLLGLLYQGDDKNRHNYLKKHLIGVDTDAFALEIARLSLTLADIPNGNGWKIQIGNIYKGNTLSRIAQQATILFCNPPFQNFSPKEKAENKDLKTANKASEILAQVLPHMPPGAVFGVIVPEGFLHRKDLACQRRYILDDFEIREICTLPDNTFESAGHPSAILMGRKMGQGFKSLSPENKISYRRISKANLEKFKDTLDVPDEKIFQADFMEAANYSYRLTPLKEVWDYCNTLTRFKEYVTIGRGIEYKNFNQAISQSKFVGAIQGYAKFVKTIQGRISEERKKTDLLITDEPDIYWMNLSPSHVANIRYGNQRKPQVLANYARSSSCAWRIKGILDEVGKPVTKHFLVITPIEQKLSLYTIWGIINSPFTNAYMFCHSMERDNLEGTLREMPIPFPNDFTRLDGLVQTYFQICSQSQVDTEKAKKIMLDIDAEVMRLYDLPPRMEKQLLDLFIGCPRKGVPFKFDRYYPEGYESCIPYHIYLSKEFQNSTVDNVKEWVEKNRKPEILEALKNAVEAFEEE